MSFIYCNIEPFMEKSKIEIHQESKDYIISEYFDLEVIPKVLIDRSEQHKINNIIMCCSSKDFVQRILNQIENEQITRYGHNNLEIEVIEK